MKKVLVRKKKIKNSWRIKNGSKPFWEPIVLGQFDSTQCSVRYFGHLVYLNLWFFFFLSFFFGGLLIDICINFYFFFPSFYFISTREESFGQKKTKNSWRIENGPKPSSEPIVLGQFDSNQCLVRFWVQKHRTKIVQFWF